MAGVNKVILVGRLGKDPEVRHLENGAAVANFSIATSETYKDKSGTRQEQTEWHNIVFWRGLAEIAEKYLKKGSQIYVEGKLRTRSWQDKDGHTRYTTEVVGDQLTMLGGKTENNTYVPDEPAVSKEPTQNKGNVDLTSDEADDLPF